MDKRRRHIILLLGAMFMVLFAISYFTDDGDYSWREDYRADNRGPFGTDVLRRLLRDYAQPADFILLEDAWDLSEGMEAGRPANYVFVGQLQFMDSIAVAELFDFVGAGNRAFIISRTLDRSIANRLFFPDCQGDGFWEGYPYFSDTAVVAEVNPAGGAAVVATDYSKPYRWSWEQSYDWDYLDEQRCCAAQGITVLGSLAERRTNFVAASYGDGWFYLHTSPVLFTNSALLEEAHLPYVEAVFSHATAGPIYWDEYSKKPVTPADSARSREAASDLNPLAYILQQPALAWAWYLLLSMAVLYLLFRSKRRQRMIPVLEKNRNTSLDFLKTIGHLYFIQQDHRKIALHKSRFLLHFIRERYGLLIQEPDEHFIEQLSAKSQISQAEVAALLRLYQNIQTSSFVSEQTLGTFYQKIEAFYNHCK